MSVRQRPRQASYSSKFDLKECKKSDDIVRNNKSEGSERNTTKSVVVSADDMDTNIKPRVMNRNNGGLQSKPTRIRNPQLIKGNTNMKDKKKDLDDGQGGGRMIQYLNLDDIPDDGYETGIASDWSALSKGTGKGSIMRVEHDNDDAGSPYQSSQSQNPPPLPIERQARPLKQRPIQKPMPSHTVYEENEEEEDEYDNNNNDDEYESSKPSYINTKITVPINQSRPMPTINNIISSKVQKVSIKQDKEPVLEQDEWSDDEVSSKGKGKASYSGYYSPIEDQRQGITLQSGKQSVAVNVQPSNKASANSVQSNKRAINIVQSNKGASEISSNDLITDKCTATAAAAAGITNRASSAKSTVQKQEAPVSVPKAKSKVEESDSDEDDFDADMPPARKNLPPLPAQVQTRIQNAEKKHSTPSHGQGKQDFVGREVSSDTSTGNESDSGIAVHSRGANYKPYTLNDYQRIKPQAYVELGKLKPDLNSDELVAKRANAQRIKEFAKNLNNFNQQALQQQKRLPTATEAASIETSRKKEQSSREKAITFAKHVPKPKPKPRSHSSQSADQANNASSPHDGDGESDDIYGNANSEMDRKLQELEARHLGSKLQVEAIKRSLGL